MITYSVKKSEVEGQEDLIVKAGHSHEFKMSDVQTHMLQLVKNVTSLKSQIELEAAKMKNVSDHHEIVSTLSPEQMVAVSLYLQAKTMHAQCESKLKEIEALQVEYSSELEEIKAQTGISIEVLEPKEEAKEEAVA
jgi:hypothetical protein